MAMPTTMIARMMPMTAGIKYCSTRDACCVGGGEVAAAGCITVNAVFALAGQ